MGFQLSRVRSFGVEVDGVEVVVTFKKPRALVGLEIAKAWDDWLQGAFTDKDNPKFGGDIELAARALESITSVCAQAIVDVVAESDGEVEPVTFRDGQRWAELSSDHRIEECREATDVLVYPMVKHLIAGCTGAAAGKLRKRPAT